MKNLSVCPVFFGVLLVCGFGYALGDLGDACSSPCDCSWPLACHDGFCRTNCFDHDECDEPYSYCANRGFLGAFCGKDNICVDAIPMYGFCDDSMVCLGCHCDDRVCYGFEEKIFFNQYENRSYCKSIGMRLECYHNETKYVDAAFVYVPDLKNAINCEVDHWGPQVCSEGYVYNIEKYPNPDSIGWPLYSLEDACIPKVISSPELPVTALFLVFLCPALIYILVVSKDRFS